MVSYAYGMTTKGTPGHVIRVDTETWDAYGEACAAKGLSRAADLRVYMNREITAHRRRVREEVAADAGHDFVVEHEDGSRTAIEAKTTKRPPRIVRRKSSD
jgi:hypothetical protein